MRKLILLLLIAASTHVAAQKSEFKYDPNSPESLAIKAKYAEYEREAQVLNIDSLVKELERLDASKRSRIALSKPEDAFAAAFTTTDEDMRAISYATVLQKRGENGDPFASFYSGVREWDLCLRLQRSNTSENWAMPIKECWQRVMPALKRASDGQIAPASFNIGRLYENGFGVTPSKFVAAEWYVKAAEQYNKIKSRELALTAVESALNIVPDHPAALRLRKAMLK